MTLTLTSRSCQTLDLIDNDCCEDIFVVNIVADLLEHFLHQFPRFGKILREERVRIDFQQNRTAIRGTVTNSHLVC